jgi:glycosyltransferase involved in cell wall biosynthesis
MRVLHLTTYLQGGAGRAITNLALAQHRRGDHVVVAASATGEPGYENYPEYLEQLSASGVRVLEVDSTFKRDLHRLMSGFATIQAETRTTPDIVHAHAAVPSIIGVMIAGARRESGPARVVQTMHGWARDRQADHVTADVHALNAVRRVTVPSVAARDQLVEAGVRADLLRVIPYGLPDREGEPAADEDLARVVEAWREQGRTIFVCIGSIGARKNQRALLDAIAANGAHDMIGLLLIGEGDLDGVRARCGELHIERAVCVAGYRHLASRHLPLADWLVLPSTREGLPLVVLEAFRAARPAIVTDLPELREAVEDGVTGLLAGADTEALAAAVRRAVALPPETRQTMGVRARQRWERDYRLERMVSAYDALYAEALA